MGGVISHALAQGKAVGPVGGDIGLRGRWADVVVAS